MIMKNRASSYMLRYVGAALTITLCVSLVFAFTSCDTVGDPTEPETEIGTEPEPVAESEPEIGTETPEVLELAVPELQIYPGRNEIIVSWDAVENAEKYVLYWSFNNHEVQIVDEKVSSEIYFIETTATEYTHELVYADFYSNSSEFTLDKFSNFSFNYLLVAKAEGYTDGVSDINYDNRVDIYLTASIDFGEDIGSAAGFRLYEVGYNSDTGEIDGPLYLLFEITEATDADGLATFEIELERGVYHGYTVFQDLNGDGVMNEGDLVWGQGDGSHTYSYWSIPSDYNRIVEREWAGENSPPNAIY